MTQATGELTPVEKRARVAAIQGFVRAREEAFDDACTFFAEAATLDPHLDLTTIPHFWNLPRGGQQAAIDAYDLAGREREAAMLIARVRKTFRPKLIASKPHEPAPTP